MPSPSIESRPIRLHDAAIELRGDRSAFLPATRSLLVVDLHVGKAESFQRRGLAVPGGSDAHDLDRLRGAISAAGARELVVLGDLFHDPAHLLDRRVESLLYALTDAAGVPTVVVRGNHDRIAIDTFKKAGIEAVDGPTRRGRFNLHHDSKGRTEVPHIADGPFAAGHIHPVARIAAAGERLRLPVFVLSPSGVILPAFGSFTGGATVRRTGGRTRIAVLDGALIDVDGRVPRRYGGERGHTA